MPWARETSVGVEPGKLIGPFVALKMEYATVSLVSMPKVMEGTKVVPVLKELAWKKRPPKLKLCEPCVQFNESSKVQVGELRRVEPVLMVAPVMPSAAPIPRLNPP